jgi:hypothetical protein
MPTTSQVVIHDPFGDEQRSLDQSVGDQVQDGSLGPRRPEQREPGKGQADVAHGGVGEQPRKVALEQAHDPADQGGGTGSDRQDDAEALTSARGPENTVQ